MAAITKTIATAPTIAIFLFSFKNDFSFFVEATFFSTFEETDFFVAALVVLVTFFSVTSFFFFVAILSP
jgi:hypothetical protein